MAETRAPDASTSVKKTAPARARPREATVSGLRPQGSGLRAQASIKAQGLLRDSCLGGRRGGVEVGGEDA